MNSFHLPRWSIALPLAAGALLAVVWGRDLGAWLIALVLLALLGCVLACVHHAEVVALRVGEPFGTLVLALAVTVIEVALIGALMLSGAASAGTLARDTLMATIMIVCNGVVGVCLVAGTWRHHTLEFRVEGASQALMVLVCLSAITLVLPTLTTSTVGPTYSGAQLAFAGMMSLLLYGLFVFIQTVRHRDYFLPAGDDDLQAHAEPPPRITTWISLGLLSVGLVVVVGLAKSLAPAIEQGVRVLQAPLGVVGIVIALMVLLPETGAAMRAAVRNRMQTSLNLALGSALASIGLTIPAVALLSTYLGTPLELGLPPKEAALLALTMLLLTITLASGRATVLHGAVHLVLFGVFLFLAVVP
jgi:Ca2+:H+ antiporter